MSRSETIGELAKALVGAQGEFSAVPKGSVNPFFKSKYAALPDVVQHAGPVLAKHGLAISQFITTGRDVDGAQAGDSLVTYLLHTSGEFICHEMRLHLVKNDPQAQGSAVTYARRYSYMSALGLVADDDDDGNAGSRKTSKAPASAPLSRDTEHQRVASLLKAIPEDNRKAFVQEAVDKTEIVWKDLTDEDLAKVELALATVRSLV